MAESVDSSLRLCFNDRVRRLLSTAVDVLCFNDRVCRLLSTAVDVLCFNDRVRRLLSTAVDVLCFNGRVRRLLSTAVDVLCFNGSTGPSLRMHGPYIVFICFLLSGMLAVQHRDIRPETTSV